MKRFLDVTAAFLGLVILSPVLIILAVLIRWKMGSPIMFTQKRAGIHGKPFLLYKFRTMSDEKDSNGELLPDEKRLTRFGILLRNLSLDELPQLLNVLKGDMSLVGPRPLLLQYVPLYSARQKLRLNVKPGLTGWAQIHGRNNLTWHEKFELDVWYVENQNFWLDLRILLMTAQKVFSREDVNFAGEATTHAFTGDN